MVILKKPLIKDTDFGLDIMYGVSAENPKDPCVSRKISILKDEHPDWEHDQIVAVAISMCKTSHSEAKHDALNLAEKVGVVLGALHGEEQGEEIRRSKSISLTKFSKLLRIIKNRQSLKFEHMAQGSMKPILPMKNFNKLQTKLEKLFTEESKNLTSEEQSRRAQYAKFMKKDFMDAGPIDHDFRQLAKDMYDFVSYIPEKSDSEKADLLFDYLTHPILLEKVIADSTAVIGKVNAGLNNIIKAPIILAREMVQKYTFKDKNGETIVEHHFKPYSELQDAIRGLDRLFMILEHKDDWGMDETLGCVRDLKADDSIRGIRGTGYFVESKLPQAILDALRSGATISVSIGFMADLLGGGIFNGEKYDFTQTNMILDHLAVCIDSIPRCPDDLCGVNVKEDKILDSEIFTLLKDNNYYYNINSNTDTIEETSKTNIIEEKSITSDSMIDGFPDKTSGLTAGGETLDFEAYLSGLRKFMGGISDPDEKAKLRRKILKTLQLNDEESPVHETKGEDNMDEKEFQDAIAAKDDEMKALNKKIADFEEEKRQHKIEEIKSLSDAYTDDELKAKNIDNLTQIADTVSRLQPSDAKSPVIPIAPKDENLRKEVEDSMKGVREKPSEIFAEVSKNFNMTNVE